jgi:hypothetical protein
VVTRSKEQRAADLEAQIDAIRQRMTKGSTDEESRAACVELAVLLRRRMRNLSTHQLLKMEFERWMGRTA